MKWLQRFSEEESTLWKEVSTHQFGQISSWCSNEVNDTYVGGFGGINQISTAKTAGQLQN